jgi:hypothetical protein
MVTSDAYSWRACSTWSAGSVTFWYPGQSNAGPA